MSSKPDTLPSARTGRPEFNAVNELMAASVSTPPPADPGAGMDPNLAALLRTRRRRGQIFRVINIRDTETNEVTLSFRVIPVTDEQVSKANDDSLVYVDAAGKPLPEGRVDQLRYRLNLIYAATAPEDKQRLWHHPKMLDEFGTLDPLDVINETLLPGEKIGVFGVIADISGFAFRNFNDAIDAAKNS